MQNRTEIRDLMPASAASLFARLADGRVHSGAQLADALGISRQAVWKQTGALREMGLDIKARAGRGYQLARPVERLDEDLVNRLIKSPAVNATVVSAVNSTNQSLLETRAAHGRALLDRKSTRLNSSHVAISYAVFCLKKKNRRI